jgi:hypothetical protein
MPRKMARQTLERRAGACYAGSRLYLGSGLLGSPENRYNWPHFRVHPGNPGLSLEHTASLLEENTDIHRQPARVISQPPDPNLGPTTSDPNVRATATGSPAAIPRERLFQRVWPRMMIGVMFVLEVVWIVFLVYSSIALVRFLLKR